MLKKGCSLLKTGFICGMTVTNYGVVFIKTKMWVFKSEQDVSTFDICIVEPVNPSMQS